MKLFDIFEGIGECKFTVQEIETERDRERMSAEQLLERRNYKFRNMLADGIAQSKKFKIESEPEDPKYGDPRNTRHRAEVFIMSRDDIRQLIQNVTYHSQADVLEFLAMLQSDMRDSATETNEQPST